MERTVHLQELWNTRFPSALSSTPMEEKQKKRKKKGRKYLANMNGTGSYCVAGGVVIGVLTVTEVSDRVGNSIGARVGGTLGGRLKKPVAGEKTWVKKKMLDH